MKKSFLTFILLCSLCVLQAQTNYDICLTPHVSEDVNFPESSRKILEQKMLRMVLSNGFGSSSNEFLLTANAQIVAKEVTAAVPAKQMVTLDVTFYVVGVRERVVVAEYTQSLTSVGTANNEASIYAQAFGKINPQSAQLRKFMLSARDKIVDYYAKRIPAILAEAEVYEKSEDYEKALALLGTVPSSLPEYPMVAERMIAVNQQMIDKFALTALAEAQSKMALRDYEGALDAVLYIDPLSTHYDEVDKLVKKVDTIYTAKEQAEAAQKRAELEAKWEQIAYNREEAQRARDDQMLLEKMRLENAQKSARDGSLMGIMQEEAIKTATGWLLGCLL